MGDCPGRESVEEGKEVKDDTFKEKGGRETLSLQRALRRTSSRGRRKSKGLARGAVTLIGVSYDRGTTLKASCISLSTSAPTDLLADLSFFKARVLFHPGNELMVVAGMKKPESRKPSSFR